MKRLTAYCDRTGVIYWRRSKGLLPIATGPEDPLRDVISVLARHSYDGETLIVAGVRDAADDIEARVALGAFSRRVEERLADAAAEVAP